ncbi:hypothetical protein BC629DRAFT_443 [Irpex lacteus]|nr:hypothetical protein BC629DRAFT_443 [Irpex lacteus]
MPILVPELYQFTHQITPLYSPGRLATPQPTLPRRSLLLHLSVRTTAVETSPSSTTIKKTRRLRQLSNSSSSNNKACHNTRLTPPSAVLEVILGRTKTPPTPTATARTTSAQTRRHRPSHCTIIQFPSRCRRTAGYVKPCLCEFHIFPFPSKAFLFELPTTPFHLISSFPFPSLDWSAVTDDSIIPSLVMACANVLCIAATASSSSSALPASSFAVPRVRRSSISTSQVLPPPSPTTSSVPSHTSPPPPSR